MLAEANYENSVLYEASTRCDCKTDCLWVRSPFEEIKYLFYLIFSCLCSGVEALSFATQHPIPSEFGGN